MIDFNVYAYWDHRYKYLGSFLSWDALVNVTTSYLLDNRNHEVEIEDAMTGDILARVGMRGSRFVNLVTGEQF